MASGCGGTLAIFLAPRLTAILPLPCSYKVAALRRRWVVMKSEFIFLLQEINYDPRGEISCS